ncbi:hypothetical protein MJO55_04420 [Mycolicibacterium rufum]|uniref:Uncharacterized protein n=1 Tax=Mycolicibacterium rufum TaxID=318424 RepID=A0ABY3UEH7_9MYCO|nr:hypothetical protein [Mycolicibacterium rufum]KGI66862.1 hypothetical protein EU78_04595 [Mycolicibacterium rufum]ULP37688.1 hypothetical protein MJO55_04420 [Mycolicibacterium rufum]
MAARRDSGGGGFVGVLGLLFLIGLIVKYIWWIVGAAAVIGVGVGIYYASRAAIRRAEEQQRLAERREEDLRIRADRQRRWTLLGDSRAVYGAEGEGPTRAVSQPPAHDDRLIARMATTPSELAALKRDKPQAWEHALFASVLMQRTAAVLPRLRDSELGFTASGVVRVPSGSYLASRLTSLIDQMLATNQQLATFVNSPAFMAAFGSESSEGDADAIEHTANRLMDYQEQLLDLSEECRALSAPSKYTDVIADCARLLDAPLQGFREFTAEYVDIIEALPRVLAHATGAIHLGGLALDIDVDDHLLSRIEKRLQAMSR